ncbi:MAG: hypothetical protein HC879_07480 [Leptolyngbyaceae cyanobacterium SL_5_9]|nr:hypothetical protein [Leptolyngbyaceae cyanobacterium SL_5_9]
MGGTVGLLAGLGTLVVPGLSGIVLATEAATAAATTLIGGAAGAAAGGLVGALIGLGIPEDRARACSDRVARGDYLVLVRGTEPEVRRAEDTLQQQGIRDLGVYSAPERRSSVAEKLGALQAVPGGSVYTESPLEAPRNAATVRANGDRYPEPQPPVQRTESATSRFGQPLRSSATVPSTEAAIGDQKRAMGVFYDQQGLEQALESLRNSNFTMHRISIVSRDDGQGEMNRHTPNLNPLSRIDSEGRVTGSSVPPRPLGGITGLLAGLNTVTVPGLGEVLVVGEAAPTLKASLAEGDFASALVRLGIPGEQARIYGDRLNTGASLIMVSGTGEEALHAASILSQHGIQDWGIYDITSASTPFAQ